MLAGHAGETLRDADDDQAFLDPVGDKLDAGG